MRDDREQILAVSQDQAVAVRFDALNCLDRNQLTELTCSVFDFCGIFPLVAQESCIKGAITVRPFFTFLPFYILFFPLLPFFYSFFHLFHLSHFFNPFSTPFFTFFTLFYIVFTFFFKSFHPFLNSFLTLFLPCYLVTFFYLLLKSTLVVDNDTTVHDVHNTQLPSVHQS